MLLTVDGSIGEGGGQILRTAIALSAIMQKAVRIVNIRKGRPRPGLGIQHVKSIEIARDMTDAAVGRPEAWLHRGHVRSRPYQAGKLY